MRVELRGVEKHFGDVHALRGVDLSLPSGSRAALVGPNGSGKSTLIRAMLGLLACDGEVRLDGRTPFEDRVALARRLAYVPQAPPQLAAPVGELLRLVCTTRRIERALVAERAAALELSLDDVETRPLRALSGGMKQKLLLALAFAADASLLVLDEPTASLDARARERFFRLVERHASQATLLLCSHRVEELRALTDTVVALDEGKVAFLGPAADFLAAQGASDEQGRLRLERHLATPDRPAEAPAMLVPVMGGLHGDPA